MQCKWSENNANEHQWVLWSQQSEGHALLAGMYVCASVDISVFLRHPHLHSWLGQGVTFCKCVCTCSGNCQYGKVTLLCVFKHLVACIIFAWNDCTRNIFGWDQIFWVTDADRKCVKLDQFLFTPKIKYGFYWIIFHELRNSYCHHMEFCMVFIQISTEVLQVHVEINLLPEVNRDCHSHFSWNWHVLNNCL